MCLKCIFFQPRSETYYDVLRLQKLDFLSRLHLISPLVVIIALRLYSTMEYVLNFTHGLLNATHSQKCCKKRVINVPTST